MVGPVGKTAERVRYVELTRQGLNNAEICRMLGIGRKTGSKWRNGYRARDPITGRVREYAPIVQVRDEAPISPRFLSEEERVKIADLRKAGHTIRLIATTLGRSPSTISRELRRNSGAAGVYRPFQAHKLARNRRTRVRPGKIATNPVLRQQIEQLMRKRWSPAQISWHLSTTYPGDRSMHVAAETIYRDLYDYRGGALKREYCRMLRTKRSRRKPTRLIPRRRSRFGGEVLMIRDRPFDPEDRSQIGNWEGDLIMGRHNRSAIATLVDRHSRYVLLAKVDAANRSDSVRDVLISLMEQMPLEFRRTLTWDQGWEMSQHAQITAATGMPIYFCDPHSPWQRGTNENTNRLLRDYFPKRTDLSVHSQRMLTATAVELNCRPRRTLNWDTPHQRLGTLIQTL